MSSTQPDSRQVRKRQALPRLGTAARASVETILDQINVEANAPLRISASDTPDAVLNFSSSLVAAADGAKEVVSPVKKQVFAALSNPTINFQTQALSNAGDFDIVFPTSTVGYFRHVCFTLTSAGKIKGTFTPEVALEANLANPGAYFTTGGLPIGYVTLECTHASGLFKTAGSHQNFKIRSEEFDNAIWVKALATVTADAAVAPDGTTTADKLIDDVTSGVHSVTQSTNITNGLTYTYSFYAKAAEISKIGINVGDARFGAGSQVYVDLLTGTITNPPTASGNTASVVDAGNGWWRIIYTAQAIASGSDGFAIVLVNAAGTSTTFAGTGTSGAYIWGAQAELGAISSYAKTTSVVAEKIENAKIFRFGSGAGGGSSTGDASAFATDMKIRLLSSFYEYVTPVEFALDEQTLTGSATAAFDSSDSVYLFSAGGQNFVSANMFNDEFLANDEDSRRVELHAQWLDSTSRDDAAVYEASLDGTNYETITMTRQGLSQRFTGDKLLAVPANATVSAQASTNTTTEMNATTVQSFSAPVVLATKNAVRQLVLELNKLGSPTGSYIISICKDSAGVPGEVLYSTIALVSSLSAGTNVITLNNFRNVLAIGTYHIKVETDATYKAGFSAGVNSIRLNTNTGGNDLVFNGTSWSTGSTDLKYSLLGHPYNLKVRITSSASGKKLQAFGVFYDENQGDVVTGTQALQKFRFSGDSNVTSFAITQFLPDANHLKAYNITTNQVYRHPSFNIDGHNITFASGTFSIPGETIELIFDQSEGSGFDNSDNNANLMAANHLGSTDATLDKSANGRGILIRNTNGELKEIWLDASNNLNITDPL